MQTDLCCKGVVFGHDLIEALLRPLDHVHLVNRNHYMADAQQRHDIAVTACLRQHPLARIEQDHRKVGRRGASDHVARVLLVTWGVGHDELAPLGGEEAVGHVDGDALLALGGQTID